MKFAILLVASVFMPITVYADSAPDSGKAAPAKKGAYAVPPGYQPAPVAPSAGEFTPGFFDSPQSETGEQRIGDRSAAAPADRHAGQAERWRKTCEHWIKESMEKFRQCFKEEEEKERESVRNSLDKTSNGRMYRRTDGVGSLMEDEKSSNEKDMKEND